MKNFLLLVFFFLINCNTVINIEKKTNQTFDVSKNKELLNLYKNFCYDFIDNDYGKNIIFGLYSKKNDTILFNVYQSDVVTIKKEHYPQTIFKVKNNWCFIFYLNSNNSDVINESDYYKCIDFAKDKIMYRNTGMFPISYLKNGKIKIFKDNKGIYKYNFQRLNSY